MSQVCVFTFPKPAKRLAWREWDFVVYLVGMRWFFLVIIWAISAEAEIQIPTNMTQNDREQALRVLGLGTSTKILSEPYPLGGYPGLEIAASIEYLDLTDLASLGSTLDDTQSNTSYPKITVGKGLYNNLDAFLNFSPYSKNSGMSQYGGLLRWGFFQSDYLPTSLSLLFHGNTTNINQNVFTQSYGVDLVAGFTLSYISIYFGGGQVESRGRFIGVNSSSDMATERVSSVHTLMGAILTLKKVFFAVEMDRYSEATISAKIGLRN